MGAMGFYDVFSNNKRRVDFDGGDIPTIPLESKSETFRYWGFPGEHSTSRFIRP